MSQFIFPSLTERTLSELLMNLRPMKFENLHDLLLLKLKSLYDIESEIIKSLPKLIKKATHPKLKAAFTAHLAETKKQKDRLEKVFSLLDRKPQKTKVEAIRGLAKDAAWIMKEDMRPKAMDASLIAAARYIEHYEMAGYMEAIGWAEDIDRSDVVTLLSMSLEEEKEADNKLDALKEQVIQNI